GDFYQYKAQVSAALKLAPVFYFFYFRIYLSQLGGVKLKKLKIKIHFCICLFFSYIFITLK
ncbi:MAG: hypothetical protein EAZ55_14850, partial [Cytophagales bacterium]